LKFLDEYLSRTFPGTIFRERQDNKARYEISSEGLRLSSLFSTIEQNKENLKLVDYGISQTSLEQVFNMHAAEAEIAKKESRN